MREAEHQRKYEAAKESQRQWNAVKKPMKNVVEKDSQNYHYHHVHGIKND